MTESQRHVTSAALLPLAVINTINGMMEMDGIMQIHPVDDCY